MWVFWLATFCLFEMVMMTKGHNSKYTNRTEGGAEARVGDFSCGK